jgi:hypothetical protein
LLNNTVRHGYHHFPFGGDGSMVNGAGAEARPVSLGSITSSGTATRHRAGRFKL